MNEPNQLTFGRHVGQIFFQRAAELGARTFIKLQKGEKFAEISWRDFAAMVRRVVLGLVALGLEPGETVAIIGENSVEWLAADLATLSGGFPNVVLSPSLSDVMLVKVLGHAECRAVFVQTGAGVGRLLNLKGQLPRLRQIIVMEGTAADLPETLSFGQLIERGHSTSDDKFARILEAVHGGNLATIMYTSGSTGEPKGVMRTQGNLLANITNGGAITVSPAEELTVNVLSLNHLFGRFGFLKSAVTGRTMAIVEAAETKLDVKIIEQLAPTAISLVPRMMERLWQTLLGREQSEELWGQLEELDQRRAAAALNTQETCRFDELRNKLKSSVQRTLGGRIKYIAYGGAAMPPRIMRFFELIGIPLIGSYGSTECGGITLCGIGENRPGNLGKPFANVQIRIAGDGEVLVRGPTVSPGYFKNPEATAEAFDEAGWFHTGDLGVIEDDGSLRIVGRKKDVFNCSDGSNIYPSFIEAQLENEPFIRQAVLLGDRRPFIAALILPDRKRIAATLKLDIASLAQSDVEAALWSQIERVNAWLEGYEQIRKIAVMTEEFPVTVRSINHFQKVKVDRSTVAVLFEREIELIYRMVAAGGMP